METCEAKACKESTFLEEKVNRLNSNNAHLQENVSRIESILDKLKGPEPREDNGKKDDGEDDNPPSCLIVKIDSEMKQYHSLNDQLNSLITSLENII